jgi:hypothetical protein
VLARIRVRHQLRYRRIQAGGFSSEAYGVEIEAGLVDETETRISLLQLSMWIYRHDPGRC